MKIDIYCDETLPDLFTSSNQLDKNLLIGSLWIESELREDIKQKIERCKLDINIFDKDLVNSKTIISKLFNRYSKNHEEVEGLILNNPKSKLFKYWARDKGYDLLIVQWNKRIVISLKGDSFYTLEGLGNKLNKLETKRREE